MLTLTHRPSPGPPASRTVLPSTPCHPAPGSPWARFFPRVGGGWLALVVGRRVTPGPDFRGCKGMALSNTIPLREKHASPHSHPPSQTTFARSSWPTSGVWECRVGDLCGDRLRGPHPPHPPLLSSGFEKNTRLAGCVCLGSLCKQGVL